MRRHSVLVVDDEQDSLDLLQRTLRKDWMVFTAKSGEAALRILETNEISLIVADQKMPEMTGTELFQKTSEIRPDVIRIVLTGYTDVQDLIDAINAGQVYRYLTKPWKPEEIKTTIKQALETLDLTKENERLMEELQEQISRLGSSIEKEIMIRKLFERYVPQEVVKEVMHRKDDDSMFKGEKKPVSILNLDIRNFTALAEKSSPEEVVSILNKFFSSTSKIIINNKGIVDKFLGDGILAVFGAPAPVENHALAAIKTALEIKKSLDTFNPWLHEKKGQGIAIGVGINSGEVVAGNVGSTEKMEYTVVGDTVNTAFRIQDFTKEPPNTILISEKTLEGVKDKVKVKSWGKKQMKGKAKELELFEVLELS